MNQVAPKNSSYYSVERREILPLLPENFSAVLDVGCGGGSTGALLKKLGASRVVGIEAIPQAAEAARQVIDEVVSLDLDKLQELPFAKNSFDLILCLDVLEHLVDPWQTLEILKQYLKPSGIILISLPNVRHFKTSLPLLFQGSFEYEDHGIRDSTHLRFFTKKSAIGFVSGANLKLSAISHTGRERGSKTWFLNLFTLGLFHEFFDFQYLIRATKP